jgi:nondiscriminating glutamyl-tRNA synthetase
MIDIMPRFRVRFAPSPTGPLHIGGARSALFNYLLAKKSDGDFIVRIEDTDRERSTSASEENIKDSLRWLGITWNEGVDIGGNKGPYRQMERLDTYTQAAATLIEKGLAYYCYCSEEELAQERQEQITRGETPHYAGNCRDLTAAERQNLAAKGIRPVIRFRVPENTGLIIDDLVRGQISFNSGEIGGDFVIVKSDGIPVYNFAVVVDDYLMEISHVVRGEEHLSNTPRQLLLLDALDYPRPVYAHVSLILGEDRSKMSKRHGSVSVVNYQKEGYLPQAIVNFLALLGWSPEGEEELLSMAELEQQFGLERVSKSPAVFDMAKLRWLNSQYLRALSTEDIAEGIKPFLDESCLSVRCPVAGVQNKIIKWQGERLLLLAETLRNHLEVFSDVRQYLPLIEGNETRELSTEAAEIIAAANIEELCGLFAEKVEVLTDFSPSAIKTAIKETGKELNLSGKNLFMPLRIALTGSMHGPDIDKLIALMGRETALTKLQSTNYK